MRWLIPLPEKKLFLKVIQARNRIRTLILRVTMMKIAQMGLPWKTKNKKCQITLPIERPCSDKNSHAVMVLTPL